MSPLQEIVLMLQQAEILLDQLMATVAPAVAGAGMQLWQGLALIVVVWTGAQWHYLGPAVAAVIAWSVAVAAGRVWFAGWPRRGRVRGRLPAWPAGPADPAPAVVVGEVHHPVAVREVATPHWLVVPELGLYTGILICGAIGSGKTSACMRPFARQLFGWQAQDAERRIAGLVLEVKGDFCHQVRGILEDAGRAEDYIELGLGGRWQWNPLGDDDLDSYSLAYTIASLINQLFGRSKEPFWQQAYVNLVRWIIELHRMSPTPWVTLRDVYRATLDPELVRSRIAEVEAEVGGPVGIRVRTADLSGRMGAVKAWKWEPAGDGLVRAKDDPKLREQLKASGIAFEAVRLGAADPERRERLAAVRRWHEQDWQVLDPKLRSSIIEGLSVFLSVFDLPDVARVFCPPAPPAAPPPSDEAPAESAVDVVRPLPPLDEVIDAGKVLCLNMPAGTNPALSAWERPTRSAASGWPRCAAGTSRTGRCSTPKLRSSIIEGLSVFLSVFDLPDVARVFCPPAPPAAPPPSDEVPAESAVDVVRPLPPLDEVIDAGKVLCLNMPAGTNPALSRAVGVLLKQAWLQTLLRRPAEMQRDPERVFRPAVFLCDEYQTFATVGEDDPAGDEKAFALTRQSRLIPIVATQSISSLRAVLGQSEAWRALLQTLRMRIFPVARG